MFILGTFLQKYPYYGPWHVRKLKYVYIPAKIDPQNMNVIIIKISIYFPLMLHEIFVRTIEGEFFSGSK